MPAAKHSLIVYYLSIRNQRQENLPCLLLTMRWYVWVKGSLVFCHFSLNSTLEFVTKTTHHYHSLRVTLIMLTVFNHSSLNRVPWRGPLNCRPSAKAAMVSRLILKSVASWGSTVVILPGWGPRSVPIDEKIVLCNLGNLGSWVSGEFGSWFSSLETAHWDESRRK